jgi:hypothetical protein
MSSLIFLIFSIMFVVVNSVHLNRVRLLPLHLLNFSVITGLYVHNKIIKIITINMNENYDC